jgi:hypothetical protein
METCQTCGALVWESNPIGHHRCRPLFYVWDPESHDDSDVGYRVYAADHEQAVERWGEQYNSDYDYAISADSGDGVIVRVTRADDGEIRWLRVWGEVTVVYRSKSAEPPEVTP